MIYDFLISFLIFLVGLFMVGCVGAFFVVIASAASGFFFACLTTPVDALVSLRREQPRRNFNKWWIYTGIASSVIWTMMALYVVVTSTDEMAMEARWALTFGATERHPRRAPVVDVSTEIRRYKLLGYNPPKHFYVDMEDVETKQLYTHIYVSKHCNNHANNQLGDLVNISVTTKKQGNRTWLVFNNLYQVFCG